MFTGIVQGIARLSNKVGSEKLTSFTFKFPSDALSGIKEGASIALNGTCLTVTGFNLAENTANFDAIEETLRLTNLGDIKLEQEVNFERAAKFGDEIGGHPMSGHIHSTVVVDNIIKTTENCSFYFKMNTTIQPYLFNKGFVGLNGCSLTIGEVTDNTFNVHLIPETLKLTTFSELVIGSKVNLELDSQTQAIVDSVERILTLKAEQR